MPSAAMFSAASRSISEEREDPTGACGGGPQARRFAFPGALLASLIPSLSRDGRPERNRGASEKTAPANPRAALWISLPPRITPRSGAGDCANAACARALVVPSARIRKFTNERIDTFRRRNMVSAYLPFVCVDGVLFRDGRGTPEALHSQSRFFSFLRESEAMKLLKTALLASAFIGLSSLGGAFAANPEPSVADVTIVGPIAITETANLNFGSIVPPASSFSDVTVDPTTSARTQTGSAVLLGTSSRATYNFDGENGVGFTISITATTACTGTGLSLIGFAHNAGATPTLDLTGVGVGGTLRVDSSASGDPGPKNCGYQVAANY